MKFLKQLTNLSLLLITILTFTFSFTSINAAQAADQLQGIGPNLPTPTLDRSNVKVEVLYFYSNVCSHCMDILQSILTPIQKQNPGQIEIRLYELGVAINYEGSLLVEEYFNVAPSQRDIPISVVGNQVIVGDAQNRTELKKLIESGLMGEALLIPEIQGLDQEKLVQSSPITTDVMPEVCTPEDPSACTVANPIYAAFFYQVGCKDCSRAETDLVYLQTKFPQLIVEEFNVYDDTALANWMMERNKTQTDFSVPALFIADNAWIGAEEILPQNIQPVLEKYTDTGSEAFWLEYDANKGNNALVQKFSSMGWLAVLLAGLVDGLNPCAFATIIFFVSYLTLSGKKGKQVILTGLAFTLGVFITYIVVGLGFYKVLDLIKDTLTLITKIVYGLTALLCLILAILSIKDFMKAKKGNIAEMSLKLPEALRKRINSTIREGRKSSGYLAGAFITGLLISLLELACTGQIYLPTIIFMSTLPEMRGQALGFLLLYNLMFIVPLVAVFVMAYYGTTSREFSNFVKKRAAQVKLGMAAVFLTLGVWLLFSVFV